MLTRCKKEALDIYIPPHTGKPEQLRFTMRTGVLILTSISNTRRGAISVRPLLPQRTDFVSALYAARQTDRPTYAPASHTMAFIPQCSPATTHYFQ